MPKGGKFQAESLNSERILKKKKQKTQEAKKRSGLKRKQARREGNNLLKVKTTGT